MFSELDINGYKFRWGSRTYVMGILNITDDSFSGDGLGPDVAKAVQQAVEFYQAGADILDIGGESTNPYHSAPVGAEEELRRVIPVIEAVARAVPLPLSIDSYKPEVARAALQAGAHIINDIHGLENPALQALAAETGAPVIAMHMRGTPQTMRQLTDYDGDVVGALLDYFARRVAEMEQAGIDPAKIILDPGFGFAKTFDQNLELLANLSRFCALGKPLLVGVSRKGFIGRTMAGDGPDPAPDKRLPGTIAANVVAITRGADIIRVHDVAEAVAAARVADAIVRH